MKISNILTPSLCLLAACSGQTTAGEGAGSDPTMKAAERAASRPATTAGAPGDIIEVATAAGSFRTLATALTQAGLVDTLKGEGPFTVFAPTDEAFAKLPEGTLDSLLKPENKAQLTKILTYHVVPGKVSAKQVVNLDSANTVAGPAIDIAVKDGEVMLNDAAKVVTTDVMAENGIIHVIDSVILPPE